MAVKVRMSAAAERQLKKAAERNRLVALLAGLFLMLGGAALLYGSAILVVQEAPAAFVAYLSPAEEAPGSFSPSMQELASRAPSPAEPVVPQLILSTGAAPVQIEQVELDVEDIPEDSSLLFEMGLNTGLDDGLGQGGIGLGGEAPEGAAFVGYYYDLKHTRKGERSSFYPRPGSPPMRENREIARVLHEFTRNWSSTVLERFWRSPKRLYASALYMPHCSADYAPVAFHCDPEKHLSYGFVVLYRGKVRAPKSGRFRFVGAGDDMLCVRFNRQMVLEAGWCIPSMYDNSASCLELSSITARGQEYMENIRAGKDKLHSGYEYVELPDNGDWQRIGGLTAGTPFEVKAGEEYPIEILISELAGGAFGYILFMEDMTDAPQMQKPADQRFFDLFRTGFVQPDAEQLRQLLGERYLWKGEMKAIPYNPDSLIWAPAN